jgi:L-seryl-tRNA(Ser) seleniumtransferase
MKMLAASPLLAQIAAQGLYAKSTVALGLASPENVYSRLGIKTVINCRGTWTYLSGSLQFPEVRAAQAEASHYFVNMVDLQRAAGRKLA